MKALEDRRDLKAIHDRFPFHDSDGRQRQFASLKAMIAAGANVVLRCPLVPGINDSDKHPKGIARIALTHPQLLGVEIMPYHNLSVSKAERIGSENRLPEIKPPTKEYQDRWIERLHALGCVFARIS